MKTITISDSVASELLAAASVSGPYLFALGTKAALLSALAPSSAPPAPPSGDWKANAASAAKAAGFDKTILYDWDWAKPNPTLDTANLGGIGVNGVLIVRFVPTAPTDSVLASVSATGYPAPSMDAGLRLCVSLQPCGVDSSPATVYSPSPTLRYCVGVSPFALGKPQGASLVPGFTYYLHVSHRDSANGRTAQPDLMHYPATDIRLSLRKPSGH